MSGDAQPEATTEATGAAAPPATATDVVTNGAAPASPAPIPPPVIPPPVIPPPTPAPAPVAPPTRRRRPRWRNAEMDGEWAEMRAELDAMLAESRDPFAGREQRRVDPRVRLGLAPKVK